MSQPPPPRYKIVEKDGRLVTIDTWAKSGALQASQTERMRGSDPKADRSRPSRASQGLVGPAPGPAEKIVAILFRVEDSDGRRLLTTGANWDRKGPRSIALSPAGEKRLGTILLIAAAIAGGLLLLAISDLEWLFPIAVIGAVLFASASKSGVPLLTRLLDSLGETLPY